MGSCLSLVAAALLLPVAPSTAATWGNTDAAFYSSWGFSDDWAVFELGNGNVQIQNHSLIYGSPTLTLQSNGDTVDPDNIPAPPPPPVKGAPKPPAIPAGTGAGDIGIAGAAGANVKLQVQTSRVGNVIVNNASGGTISANIDNLNSVASVTSRDLTKDVTAANNLSSTLAALATSTTGLMSSNAALSNPMTVSGPPGPPPPPKGPPGNQYGTLNLNNQNLTLTATNTTPVVFNLGTFNINKNSILTLSGSADSEFVFNIYGGDINMNQNSGIVLTGGLTPADVIFNNIAGTKPGDGPAITNHSYLSGIILATQQSVNVGQQSIVFGAVISNGLTLNDHSIIESPDN